jgi:hypothetical protein
MNRLQARLHELLAAAYVPAVSLISVLCATVLVVLPAPSVAAIDCWGRHPGHATVPSGQRTLLPGSGPQLCPMARRRCSTGSYGR